MLLSLLLTGPAAAADWEWRADLGAQLDPSPHGVLDIGVRAGAFSAQLLTDSLDLRWSPETERGRWWIAARGEAGAAGLLISPWTAGTPDPTRALSGDYGGVEGGWLRYLPKGFYAGAQTTARYYAFTALAETTILEPAPRLLSSPELLLGYWTPALQGWARAGADLGVGFVSPHIAAALTARPEWTVAPRVELRVGAAQGADFLTTTRLGGLNPYVVPLAGAGWAEWWVEDYAASRIGPDWRAALGQGTLSLATVADLAWFDGDTAAGFAGLISWKRERFSVETSLGYAPWIPRATDLSRVAGWTLLGWDWP